MECVRLCQTTDALLWELLLMRKAQELPEVVCVCDRCRHGDIGIIRTRISNVVSVTFETRDT